MKEKIYSKITNILAPSALEVLNFSDDHKGHSGDNGSGESHFEILVVSNKFINLPRVERHKLIYKVLSRELVSGLHALKISSFTEDEYEKHQQLKNSKK